jgi:membrane protein involved in colicin uptake
MEEQTPDSAGAVTYTGQPQPAADAPPQSWDEVFKHPRFKELQKMAKEAQAALEAQKQAQAQAEETKLKEQAKWQELYEAERTRAEQVKAELEAAHIGTLRIQKQQALKDAARSHEPPFVAEAIPDILLLVAIDELPDDADMAKAADAKVKELAKSKPWLLSQARSDPGSPPGRKPVGGVTKPTGTGKPMGL